MSPRLKDTSDRLLKIEFMVMQRSNKYRQIKKYKLIWVAEFLVKEVDFRMEVIPLKT